LNLFYTNNLAINKKAINANDLSVEKQLIYVPQEKYGFNFRSTYKGSSLMIKHHYVSHRFTTTDNSLFMPSYHLFDIQFQQHFNLKQHSFIAQVYIDNIFNKSYESIPFQVMPARVFGMGFNYLFNKKENTK
jgi:iron complex outermembrane receptor protein